MARGSGFQPVWRRSWRVPMTWQIGGLFVLVAVAVLGHAKGQDSIEFRLSSSSGGALQLFYDRAGEFSEFQSTRFVPGSSRRVRVPVTGDQGTQLRFDPGTGGTSRICDLSVSGLPIEWRILHTRELDARVERSCLHLEPWAAAEDPGATVLLGAPYLERARTARRWQAISMFAGVLAIVLGLHLFVQGRTSIAKALGRVPENRFGRWLASHLWIAGASAVLALGTAYAFSTPPGAVPDEATHMARMVKLTSGVLVGHDVAKRYPDVESSYRPVAGRLLSGEPIAREELIEVHQRRVMCEPTVATLPRGADGYFPHHYLLTATAYRAACAVEAPFGAFLYSARLLNLLAFTALVAFGLRCAGFGRWGLLLVALLPMTLFQAASISADSVWLGLNLAWLGVVSGLASGTLDPKRATPALLLLSYAIALSKPGSAWILAALLLARPAWSVSGRSFLPPVLLFVAFPMLVHVAWSLAAAGSAPGIADVDPRANLDELTSRPWVFLALAWETYAGPHLLLLYRGAVGVLGWLDVPLPVHAYGLAAAALACALVLGEPVARLPGCKARALALVLAGGSLLLVALPLYVYWTPTGLPWIRGLQGRYFLPTIALVLAWCAWRSPPGLRSIAGPAVLAIAILLNAVALLSMVEAYHHVGRVR